MLLNASIFELARHRREVGTGYFDLVSKVVPGGGVATLAIDGSTEQMQL